MSMCFVFEVVFRTGYFIGAGNSVCMKLQARSTFIDNVGSTMYSQICLSVATVDVHLTSFTSRQGRGTEWKINKQAC